MREGKSYNFLIKQILLILLISATCFGGPIADVNELISAFEGDDIGPGWESTSQRKH